MQHKPDNHSNTLQYNKGITIFFAILIIGLLIGIGAAISGLAQKQLLLSSTGKQSQVAFYAADSGAECARYWDLVKTAFSTTSPLATIVCNGLTITVTHPAVQPVNTVSTFSLPVNTTSTNYSPGYSYCADVTVSKDPDTDETNITSRGYNTDCGGSSSRKVERAIYERY